MDTLDVLNAGCPVSLIWYEFGEPQAIIATVCHDSPLTLETSRMAGHSLRVQTPCKVMFQREGTFETASAVVAQTGTFGSRLRFTLDDVDWLKTDRRSHPRFPSTLLAKCRYVSEDAKGAMFREFTVTTRDLSMGGAWVMSDSVGIPGSILTCELSTGPNTSVRVLAVVAWADQNGRGFGIEFLDFVGDSRTILNTHIKKLAA